VKSARNGFLTACGLPMPDRAGKLLNCVRFFHGTLSILAIR
jgi:hypothetical protein